MKYQSEHIIKIGETEGPDLLELSVSKAKKWRSCQQAYVYKYVEKLRPKRTATALRRGSWVHQCIEDRDNGKNWVESIRKLKREEYDQLFQEEKDELGDLPQEVFRMMRAYTQTYKDIDEAYETVKCEQDFMIRIPGTNIVLTGKIDKIARHKASGKIWIFEHKTMKNLPPSEEFRITDIQTAVYEWVTQKLAPYLKFDPRDIAGVVFDYIKTKPPTIPDVLKDGSISKRKIDCDWYTYAAVVTKAGLDPEDYLDMKVKLSDATFFKRVPMAKVKHMVKITMEEVIHTGNQINMLVSTGQTCRNLSWNCDRPKCEYRDLCIADLQGHDTDTMKRLLFETKEEETEQNGQEGEE